MGAGNTKLGFQTSCRQLESSQHAFWLMIVLQPRNMTNPM